MVLSRSIFNGLCALALLLAGCGGGGSSTPTYSLGGTVVGLSAGQQVLLLSGAGTQVTLSSNGNFRFPDRLPKGSKYNLVVQQQPSGQTCVVSNGTDTAGVAADVSNVTVVCSDNPAVLGGTVSGLPSGTSVSLSTTIGSAGAASLASIGANGTYSLAQRPASGATYAVTITTQPQGASCTVSNGSGTAGATAITNIDVVCSPARMNIGGEPLGLDQGQQVQLTLAGTGVA